MSAEPGIEKAARREKIVMALGIAAVILFSANLLTMVARHFWPDLPLFGGNKNVAVGEFETMELSGDDHAVHVFLNRQGHEHGAHGYVIRLNGEDVHVHARDAFRDAADRIESELRIEMDRLHRDIARQQSRLEADMNARRDVRLKTLNPVRIRVMKEDRERAMQSAERAADSETALQSDEQALDRALVEIESELASIQQAIVIRQKDENR